MIPLMLLLFFYLFLSLLVGRSVVKCFLTAPRDSRNGQSVGGSWWLLGGSWVMGQQAASAAITVRGGSGLAKWWAICFRNVGLWISVVDPFFFQEREEEMIFPYVFRRAMLTKTGSSWVVCLDRYCCFKHCRHPRFDCKDNRLVWGHLSETSSASGTDQEYLTM